jgi:hypothetical protein
MCSTNSVVCSNSTAYKLNDIEKKNLLKGVNFTGKRFGSNFAALAASVFFCFLLGHGILYDILL